MGTDGIDPELVRRFYRAYLELTRSNAIQSRAEGCFEQANLFEEIVHQWENMNFVTQSQEYPGLFSAYMDELSRMDP